MLRKASVGTLGSLVERLASIGLQEYAAVFDPMRPSQVSSDGFLEVLPGRLRTVATLFLLGNPVDEDDAVAVLGDLVPDLINAGILRRSDHRISTSDLVLHHRFGYWLFTEKPRVSMSLYFGDDSMALLARLAPPPSGNALDLCGGPGIQSLHLSSFVKSVTLVEINPVAAALARVNSVMNLRQESVRVICGDLYKPIGQERFNIICANPPLLPFPSEIPYPFVGHGGDDGLRVTRRILAGLPSALHESGRAQLIGSCLGDGMLPLCLDELQLWSEKSCMTTIMTTLRHIPISPGSVYFEGLVDTAAAATRGNREAVASAFERSLSRQGATSLCLYYLHVTHGYGRFDLIDLADDEQPGFWFF